MKVGDKVTLKTRKGTVKGRAIGDYPHFILVQHKNYRESYLKADLITKDVEVLKIS